MSFSLKRRSDQHILHRDDCPEIDKDWFDIARWRQRNEILGQSSGRNITWFVGTARFPLVLRHYYRGGLVGKLLHDSYLFTGWKQTRAYREFVLLQQLAELGLPACRAVAARIKRSGLIYRADLLMEQVSGGRDLVAHLQQGPLSVVHWQQIGKTLAEFHRHGVYHADLNAHNILLDEQGKVWLIDFDRGAIRAPQPGWQQQNIARLKRSFEKEVNRLDHFHYDDDCWSAMHSAYHQALSIS